MEALRMYLTSALLLILGYQRNHLHLLEAAIMFMHLKHVRLLTAQFVDNFKIASRGTESC